AQALEDPVLAPDHELNREPGEGGVRAAVSDEPREQRLGRRDAVDLPRVDRAEQQVEQQREEEDEEGRLPAAPEDELLRAELVGKQRARRPPARRADRLGAHWATSAQ